MTENDFILETYVVKNKKGKTSYRSPSNIALVKYWGKKENQIPANPSISFTLDACATTTTVSYKKLESRVTEFSFDLILD